MKEIEFEKNHGYKKSDELNEEEKAELKKSEWSNDVGNKSNMPRFKLPNMYHEQYWKHPTMKTIHEANIAMRKLKSK